MNRLLLVLLSWAAIEMCGASYALSVENKWPDPQLQISLLSDVDGAPSLVSAEKDDLSGPMAPIAVRSFEWDGIYQAGTCRFVHASKAVSCVGAALAASLQVGDWIKSPAPIAGTGYDHWYPIAAVRSDSALDLGFAFEEPTQSNVTYVASGYFSRHRRLVKAFSNNTGNLKPGDLLSCLSDDPVLTRTPLMVISVNPNFSFTFRPEYIAGLPREASKTKAAICQIVRQGVRDAHNLSQITNRVFRLGDATHSPLTTLETSPHFTGLFRGATRVLYVEKAIDRPEYIYYEPSKFVLGLFRGRWQSAGVAIAVPTKDASLRGVAAKAFIYAGDGSFVYGPPVTTSDGRRHWSGVTREIPLTSTDFKAGVELDGPSGTQFLIAEFFETPGFGYTQDGVFSTPEGQIVTTARGILIDYGTDMTGPATVDPSNLFGVEQNIQQATFGRLGPGVSEMWAHVEAQTNANGRCAILSYRNNLTDPITYGPFLFQQVPQPATKPPTPGNYMGAEGWIPVSNSGVVWETGCADVITEFRSVDTHKFELWSSSESTSIP